MLPGTKVCLQGHFSTWHENDATSRQKKKNIPHIAWNTVFYGPDWLCVCLDRSVSNAPWWWWWWFSTALWFPGTHLDPNGPPECRQTPGPAVLLWSDSFILGENTANHFRQRQRWYFRIHPCTDLSGNREWTVISKLAKTRNTLDWCRA